jgi:hypothetical protein
MYVYHVTTHRKARKYVASKCILPPVRFWSSEFSAVRWARKTGRSIILAFEAPDRRYPLPIKGGAYWSPDAIPLTAFEEQLPIFQGELS